MVARAGVILLLLFSDALVNPYGVAAQPLLPQFGGKFLPERQERTDFGVHFALLTEFDKDTVGNAFTFRPYSDRRGVLGINVLSYQTVRAWRPRYRKGATALEPLGDAHNVLVYEAVLLGGTGDAATQYLQNDVIHAANWRGREKLLPVPRRTSDTPDGSPTSGQSFAANIAQYSTAVTYRLSTLRREGHRDIRHATPIFAGGGYSVGTLFQEAFVQLGLMDFDFVLDRPELLGFRLLSLGGFGAGRAGVLLPGPHFPDLTEDYQLLQAGLRSRFAVGGFPIEYEFVRSAMRGFFVAPRTSDQWDLIAMRGQPARDVYEAKTPRRERFGAHRVRIGGFSFQVSNDSPGGKDSGPTFSAQMTWEVTHERWEGWTPSRLLQRGLGL